MRYASKMPNVQHEHGGKLDQEERGDDARVSGDDGQRGGDAARANIVRRHAFPRAPGVAGSARRALFSQLCGKSNTSVYIRYAHIRIYGIYV